MDLDELGERLLMSQFGAAGNKLAHMFLQDRAASPLRNLDDLKYVASRRGRGLGLPRIFVPPKNEDRVIMFADNSGVYVHSDGFCTPMGDDIRHEIGAWKELL